MNKNFILSIVIIIILSSTNLYSQKLGSLFIGTNNYLVSGTDNRYNVNATGLNIGWLILLNVPNVKIFYKVKASHHTVKEYFSYQYDRELEYFFSAVNEILIGKNIRLNNEIDLIPQLGFGAIGEAAYYDLDRGFTHGELLVDFSLISVYNLKSIGLGLMINFEKDIVPSVESLISDRRLNIAFIISG